MDKETSSWTRRLVLHLFWAARPFIILRVAFPPASSSALQSFSPSPSLRVRRLADLSLSLSLSLSHTHTHTHTTLREASQTRVLMSSICSPRVIPQPKQDCLDLHRAVEGLGCDGPGVISILAHRDAHQRSQIKAVYESLYHEDICKRLKSELHFHFEKAMLMWMQDPPERDAMLLKDALDSTNSTRKNQIITEILSTKSMNELEAITKAYNRLYGRPLQKDLAASVTGLSQKIFVQYLDGRREETVQVEPYFSLDEAKKLHYALATSIDDTAFLQVMTTRTREQIRSIFDAYKTTYGQHVYEVLKEKGTTESHKVLKIFSKCISAPEDYFAKVLYRSMKGLGTDDDTLIRVVVTCAEVNMATIKLAFFRIYAKVLSDMIASDTTGNYRKFLLALIGAPY